MPLFAVRNLPRQVSPGRVQFCDDFHHCCYRRTWRTLFGTSFLRDPAYQPGSNARSVMAEDVRIADAHRKKKKWDRQDSNLQPRDYAFHFDFRRLFRVCGLDHPFTLRVCRLVSTPSAVWQLGSGLACFLRSLAFPEFDRFYQDPVRLTCRPQDQGNPCGDTIQNPNRNVTNFARVFAQALPLKSPALTVELRSHAPEYILDFGFCRSCLDRL